MRAALLASSHCLQPVAGDALPDLTDALAQVCRTRYRRIDRFARLALLGSARCVEGQRLEPGCGVYMASALGPLGSNIRAQEHMLRENQWPMPFDFIHTLGGSAGFYVASNLRLDGPNWFLGSDRALSTAMTMALTDLAAGVVRQALVGVVEEAPLPVAAQRRRLKVADDVTLAEGSHWWLLGADADVGRPLSLCPYESDEALAHWLDEHATAVDAICLARDLDADRVRRVHAACTDACTLDATSLPFHASIESAWVAEQCARDAGGSLLLVDNRALFHLGA